MENTINTQEERISVRTTFGSSAMQIANNWSDVPDDLLDRINNGEVGIQQRLDTADNGQAIITMTSFVGEDGRPFQGLPLVSGPGANDPVLGNPFINRSKYRQAISDQQGPSFFAPWG